MVIGSIGGIGPGLLPLSLVAQSPKPVRGNILFVQNVDELSRVEYLAARLTLNKLDVLFAGDDADLRMFAR